MGVLGRSLNEERCLCWRMNEEEEKICVYSYLGFVHGRACGGTGHANSL